MNARPARIREVVAVDIERPRHRDDPAVSKLERRIAGLLDLNF